MTEKKVLSLKELGEGKKTTRKQSSYHLWCVWPITIDRVLLIILHFEVGQTCTISIFILLQETVKLPQSHTAAFQLVNKY